MFKVTMSLLCALAFFGSGLVRAERPTCDIETPVDLYVSSDNSARICVTFSGDPKPTLTWDTFDMTRSAWARTDATSECVDTPGDFTINSGDLLRVCGTNTHGTGCSAQVKVVFVEVTGAGPQVRDPESGDDSNE